MKKWNKQDGILLISLITIIIVIIIVVGVGIYIGFSSKNKEENNNTTIQEGSLNSNMTNTQNDNNEINIDEIRKTRYVGIFGENGTGVYPPQSYISNNILSINPDKDKRFYVVSASNSISSSSGPNFVYTINEDEEVEIEIKMYDPEGLVLQENVDGIDIFITKKATASNLKNIRYILLEEIPNNAKNSNYSKQKCYIIMKPSDDIENKEIARISKYITIDKSRGEYSNDVEGGKIIASDEYFKQEFGNIVFDFQNAVIVNWTSMRAGNNEIIYGVKQGSEYPGAKVVLPVKITVKEYFTVEEMKKNVQEINESEGLSKQEIIETEVNGIKFYGVRNIERTDNVDISTNIFMELPDGKLAGFYNVGSLKTEAEIKMIIEERIMNKIVFVK